MGKYTLEKLPADMLNELAIKHREVRKKAKLSQADLAERSGVSLGSIKRFESTGQIALLSFLKLLLILDRLDEFDLILATRDTERIENLFSSKTRRS
jgi:transcriptional regulator with XRE-family HTH domain